MKFTDIPPFLREAIAESDFSVVITTGDLQRAVSDKALTLCYQPVVDLESGDLVGAEALLRWPLPDGQVRMGPDEFIPLAEQLGLMGELGRHCRVTRHSGFRSTSPLFSFAIQALPPDLSRSRKRSVWRLLV